MRLKGRMENIGRYEVVSNLGTRVYQTTATLASEYGRVKRLMAARTIVQSDVGRLRLFGCSFFVISYIYLATYCIFMPIESAGDSNLGKFR